MKKNEEPHRLYVVFKRQKEVCVESFACSCAASQGLCYHVIGFMYTLAHYQMLGLKSVPPVVSGGVHQAYILLFQILAKGFIYIS